MKTYFQNLLYLYGLIGLLIFGNTALADIVDTNISSGVTNPVTLAFILVVGFIFGVVMFYVFRQLRLYFFQREVVLNRESPKTAFHKYWGKGSITAFSILALFAGLSLCFLLIWILERETLTALSY